MNGPTPQSQIIELISSFWLSRSLHAAALFGLADCLKDGPLPIADLAKASGTNPDSLRRLMRALASAGIFAHNPDGTYGSTPLAATLETDVPGSLRNFVMAELGQEHYGAWESFPHSIATGEMAFEHKYHMPVWEYYAKHPDHAKVFNGHMSKTTEANEAGLLASYDFSGYKRIVDIGGGHGQFLTSVLKQCPQSTGLLFDAPGVVAQSKAACDKVGGNFFEAVPAGGDGYIMKWILHDWNDEECITILKNIAKVMNKDGRVLTIEAVVPDNDQPHFAKWLDLNMMVMTGGRERTAAEYGALYDKAGLEIVRIVPTQSLFSVVEGKLKA